jgi:hypothetical protein
MRMYIIELRMPTELSGPNIAIAHDRNTMYASLWLSPHITIASRTVQLLLVSTTQPTMHFPQIDCTMSSARLIVYEFLLHL